MPSFISSVPGSSLQRLLYSPLRFGRERPETLELNSSSFWVESGDVSGIVETRFGLHLIQLIDNKPSVEIEEADASEQIEFYLWQQGYQRLVEEAVDHLKKARLLKREICEKWSD